MERINDIKEIQKRLLAIADAFHHVCIDEGIPYYMIGGTMLGAIRHKGFIPWDDDMDFGVPRPYFEKLIEALEGKLPEGFRCLTYKNCQQIKYPFIKIEDTATCIDDVSLDCLLEEKPGLNIDVFPIDDCDKGGWRIARVFFYLTLQTLFFVKSTSHSIIKAHVKKVLMHIAPTNRLFFLTRLEYAMTHAGNGYRANLMGRCRYREILKPELFKASTTYPFEDISLNGLDNYDAYLTFIYGNYMKLPPEGERQAHVENVFRR